MINKRQHKFYSEGFFLSFSLYSTIRHVKELHYIDNIRFITFIVWVN